MKRGVLKKMVSLVLVACITLLWSSQLKADLPNENYTVKLSLRGWYEGFDARLKDESNGQSDDVDFTGDLGLDDGFTKFNGKIDLRFWDRHHIRIGYWRYDDDATVKGSGTITFNNKRYQFTSGISTDMDLKEWSVGYQYDFIKEPTYLVGGIIDVKIFSLDISLCGRATDISTGITTQESYSYEGNIPLPLVGLIGKYSPFSNVPLALVGELEGITAGSRGYIISTELAVEYEIISNMSLEAGYKLEYLKIDVSDLEGHLRVGGFFAGVNVKF